MSNGARAVARKAKEKTGYVFTQARTVKKDDPRYWTTQARQVRKLFPSEVFAVAKDGNRVQSENKLVLRTAPHVGKRDVFEYLRKVYGLRVLKVNSLNFPGKLKRSMGRRAQHVYRSAAFKKFYVTLDPAASLALPEERLEALEAEVVGAKQ